MHNLDIGNYCTYVRKYLSLEDRNTLVSFVLQRPWEKSEFANRVFPSSKLLSIIFHSVVPSFTCAFLFVPWEKNENRLLAKHQDELLHTIF